MQGLTAGGMLLKWIYDARNLNDADSAMKAYSVYKDMGLSDSYIVQELGQDVFDLATQGNR
ncbi:MAG: hypothetical protein ACYSWU_04325 [Planctomycetota bacterium]